MKPIVASRRSSAPPDRVFAVASDFANAPAHCSAITALEILTPGPVGRGTRFRETRTMFGKPATETMEVVAWDPPRAYTLAAASCGAEFRSEVRCVPDAGGTRIEIEMRAKPLTLFAKLMSPLTALMAGRIRACLAQDLDDIARAAEGAAPVRAA